MAVIVLNGEPLTVHAPHSLCCEVERQLAEQFDTARTFHLTDYDIGLCLDEPDTVTPEARSRGEVPACLVRLTGPCRFRLP